jgi:hypothetical protein
MALTRRDVSVLKERQMQKRRDFKQPNNVEQQCAEEALRLRESAELLPPGPTREAALRKARQLETASRMSEWLVSSELQAPK